MPNFECLLAQIAKLEEDEAISLAPLDVNLNSSKSILM
jgi:hypothetical protein